MQSRKCLLIAPVTGIAIGELQRLVDYPLVGNSKKIEQIILRFYLFVVYLL